ncbi:UvrD-helicase domain-containing protein [Rhizobium aegyptiacum]|uniref:UvrD-helicase domain-containing protein n=1 Tax=Rhizobium aegyptiacum TaxID=1764550 RepID=UPI0007E57EAE|nr:UvrD-helicase domain-containing protein [Rhizobium aegyptiacum]
MQLSKGQLDIMASKGHLLVTGGPGSGKTTISILKAGQIIDALPSGHKVLFLSFARATVSRVMEAIDAEKDVAPEIKRRIDVETYHSFFWRILKAHGYLLGLPRRLTILTPPAEAIALSEVRHSHPGSSDGGKAAREVAEEKERWRLAKVEGRVCFDFYADLVGDLLHQSSRVRQLVSTMYPCVILDEFQDTNAGQWRVVQALGRDCRLIALADPEQRIFDFIGADPKRLDDFRGEFSPTEVDLSTDNHRSSGTEIAKFGNDVLKGVFQQTYAGVEFEVFEAFSNLAMSKLVTTIYGARQRLIHAGVKDWSLAILVPTKKMTRLVSDILREPPGGMAAIRHTPVIDMEAAILGSEVVAFLMQCPGFHQFEDFVELVCNYYQGKGGNEPTKSALEMAARLHKAHQELKDSLRAQKPLRKTSIINATLAAYESARGLVFTGNPDTDWQLVRSALAGCACSRLNEIATEVRNIRILERGTELRHALSEDWRQNGSYRNSLKITRQAFVREHFSMGGKPERGVVVMNMHKAKGKQFDEVIVFEGWPIKQKGKIIYNGDRIVRFNSKDEVDDQVRQNLRVSVTRGKRRVTVMTPRIDPCVLLV